MSLKKVGAELIIGTMLLPWLVWVTISIFDSKTASAVTENKYQNIIEKLEEIKARLPQ